MTHDHADNRECRPVCRDFESKEGLRRHGEVQQVHHRTVGRKPYDFKRRVPQHRGAFRLRKKHAPVLQGDDKDELNHRALRLMMVRVPL